MSEITQVETEAEYEEALARISELLKADYDSPEGKELDRITDLVIAYEDEHYPMDSDPNPHSMLEFMLDQQMVSREQLVPLAGGDAALDAILEAREALTPALVQVLHERFGTPVEELLKNSVESAAAAASDLGVLTEG